MRIARTVRRKTDPQRDRPAGNPVTRPAPLQLKIRGIKIEPDSLVRVSPAGDRVFVAQGRAVESYEIVRVRGQAAARRLARAALPAAARDLAVSPDGALYALTRERGRAAAILHVEGERVTTVRALDAETSAFAATRSHLVLAAQAAGLAPPELLLLRRRDGRVLAREPLATANVRFRTGRSDELLVVEPGAQRMRWVNTRSVLERCQPGGGSANPTCPEPTHPRPGHPCGCGCAPPCAPPSDRPANRPPVPRDPNDDCVPGGDGDPDGCIVTYVQDGWAVSVNLCEPEQPPCSARMDWPSGSIARTPRTAVATSRDGRRIAILDNRTMQRLHEQRAGRGTLRVFVARGSDSFFLLDEAGALTLLDPTPVLPALDVQLTADTSQAVYMGQSAATDFNTSGIQIGTRNVLVVPVREPGQTFNGEVEDFRDYYEIEDIIETTQSFYHEASYHNDPDNMGMSLQFHWFGADTPTLYTGAPILLDKPLRDYWGPAWDPGAVSGTVPVPGGGLLLTFSGDETLQLEAFPSPTDVYEQGVLFDVRFPAASYRVRLPGGLSTISLGPTTAPARSISVQGTDRGGSPFSISVDTSVLAGTTQIDLVRSLLSVDTSQQDALADVIEELLASAGGLFERPSVVWQDDADQAGMLHVSLSFAAGAGGAEPVVTAFNLDDLLALGPGSRPSTFDIPTDVGALQTFLSRVVADASVRHPDFGSDLSRSYFDLVTRPPSAVVEGGSLTVRINLSTRHGRYPARIDVQSQSGLAAIGMDSPTSITGADTSYSGGGGPKHEDNTLFDDVFTAMIDATINAWGGNQEGAIDEFNRIFNCVGMEEEHIACGLQLYHNVVVTPVYPVSGASGGEADVADLRGACKRVSMDDVKADSRAKPVFPIGANRAKIVMKVAPNGIDDPNRAQASAGTLTHELGHGLLGLPDLYSGGVYRAQVQYVGFYDLMGSSSSISHFGAYNKRIKGWLDDDAILLLDRPHDSDVIDREVVLIQLEHWDPLQSEDERASFVQALLPGTSAGTPVVAAVFLRLGGDGRIFDIVELRGRGERYSQDIHPARIVVTNAIDPNDDTRYAEDELEGAGTTAGTLEFYRRKVHLLSDTMQAAGAAFDFATEPEFPEVGLRVEVLEWGTGTTGTTDVAVARVLIHWERGPAIDLGFVDATPDWQSPDIAVFKPGEFDETDGSFTFPESQDPEVEETFLVPADGEGDLQHRVGVRVWNFGDAEALNVQVELVLRYPEGAGDWEENVIASTVIEEVPPSDSNDPVMVGFDWDVQDENDTHMCLRAQIGDVDVPRNDQGMALASDDTNAQNDWAQQNISVYEAPSDSPPEPVEFTFQVNNGGSYMEDVRIVPRGLGSGALMTVTPGRLRIAPHSRGYFRVRVELEERLLHARCGKDITFLLEAWRGDDDAEERWGAAKYVIKPRFRTETLLNGSIMFERVHLLGHVSPDVGAQRILLHIQRPGRPSLWEELTLGPAATFDFELEGEFPAGEEVLATAHFQGTNDYASSRSETLTLSWHLEG